jgi:hypothetical protein
MTDDILGQLKPRSPRRVLDDLAPIARALAAHGRPQPEIELYLMSGQTLRGRFLGTGDDRDGTVVLVHVGGNQREPAVAYLRADQLAAVVVVDASLLVRGPASDQPIPSKLELARQAAAKADTLASKLGRALKITITADDDDARRAAGILLPMLVDVLVAIASDDMGKRALAELTSIELGAASPGEVARHERTLIVRAPKLLSDAFTLTRLRAEVEKLL